jgi:serine/threonine protein kinase/Tol biopolymer transport system component
VDPVDHYRIFEPLGGGGMGIVYRAEDTRLGRTVALKFLPPELTRDPVAKARFLQEARTASALDHPNICTIYDVGETADARLYLSMPCYDGETLREHIERGPLPLEDAMDIAWQTARGLAKAHRQGIVHRDVKPANLMVTADGVVKILDFGIAKLAGAAGLTRTGLPLGTPAYMAPEQMKGDDVDARTDLWSLGVVLYEMLTGRRPFPGDHEVVVRHGILNVQPEPVSKLRPELPRELDPILAGLLAKEPKDRYATAESLLADLRPLVTSPSGTRATAASTAVLPRRPWLGRGLGLGLLGLAVAAGLGILLWRTAGRPPESPLPSVQDRLTDLPGIETQPSLAPAGDFFVYVKAERGNLDIFRQRTGGNANNLTADSPADDSEPAFSPDGNFIAFRSERDGGGLFLMGATGESVRRLTEAGYDPAWSPDGKEIVYATAPGDDPRDWGAHSRLWRIEVANPSRRRLVADVDGVQPSWSPGGRRIAYWSVPTGRGQRILWTIPASGGEPVRVTDDTSYNWSPAWSPDGRYLFFASDRKGSMNLWRVPIDEDTGKVLGAPEPVTSSSQWNGPLRLSRDGRRIVYAARDERSNLEKAAFDPAGPSVVGAPEPISQSAQAVSLGGVSPDGRWIVFRSTAPQEDLFLVRPDGTGLLQLTRGEAKDRGPVWMPDGRILFFSDRSKSWEAWTIRPDGSELRQLTDSRVDGVYRPLVSPDGRWLICVFDLAGTVRIDLSRPPGQRAPEPLPSPAPGVSFYPNSWSPDGRRLLGTGTGAGFGIFVYTPATRSFEKLADRGLYPVWMRDGRRLLYLDEGKIRLLDSRTKESRDLLAPPPGSTFSGLDLSPDERTLYLGRTTPEGDIWMLSTPENPENGQ